MRALSVNNLQDKKQLRRFFKQLRDEIPDKDTKSENAAGVLCSQELIAQADTILIYSSFGSELGTQPLFNRLSALGKKIAFPRCLPGGIMTFHLVESMEELLPGSYGIFEPDENLPQPVLTSSSVCIVPGLAFTENGARLGYGGGFYDRFTSANPELCTVGYSFEEQLTPQLPLLPHDLRVNYLATNERMVICSG